jgi:hypothetical protein
MVETTKQTAGGAIEFDPEKASKGGLQGIIEFQGDLVSHERIANKFGETRKKFGTEIQEASPDQIEVKYEDVVITEMEEGEEEPDLKEGKYNILINYAKPGQPKANALSQWNKGYADTCKAVHKCLPSEMEGKRVTMRKMEVSMKLRDSQTKEEKEVKAKRWCFVTGSAISPASLDDKAKKEIEGKNKGAALRSLAQNAQLRKETKYKEAVTAGNPIVGLVLNDAGVYVAEK